MIVDEVLAVGDAEFQDKCLGKMQQVSSQQGRTVLFVSHNLAAVSRLCNNAVMITRGALDSYGPSSEIIEKYTLYGMAPNEINFSDNSFLKFLAFRQENNTLSIECHYDAPFSLEIPCLGFVVSSSMGNKLFGTNPNYQPPVEPIRESRKGVIKVKIVEPKLLNGKYQLSVWFGDGKTDYQVIENVLSLDVINMVNYKREAYAQNSGPISPEIYWEYEYHD